MDLDFWKSEWTKAQQTSSLAPGYRSPDNWEAFWNQYAERYGRENRQHFFFSKGIVDQLLTDGVISTTSRILDIGCGPGTYTIPLAAKTASVTGIDTARQMLEVMKNESKEYGVADRVKTFEGSWLSFAEGETYDLVLGANTPAIKDYDSLMKMNRLSRCSCCLISFAGSYQSTLRSQIWQQIMEAPLKSRAFDIQFPFNLLYLEGFFPNIRFYPYHWTPSYPIEEMVLHYTDYFRVFGKNSKQVEQKIQSFFKVKAENGQISDDQQGTIAVIWWKINKKGDGAE
ncbi:class I SAM-dependent methyltransferase [bacterium]|nr:class I SAM-dependent methyltransferase [bacterium]